MTTTKLTNVGDRGEHKGNEPRLWPDESDNPWKLRVVGEVEHERTYTLDDLMKWQAQEMPLNVHCVSVGKIYKPRGSLARFTGISLDQILREVVPKPHARTVVFVSAVPGWAGPPSLKHETPLELHLCQAQEQVMLAWSLDGEPLKYANGGPLRSVVNGEGIGEKRYFYKSLKWLSKIEVIAEPLATCDRGTWEQFAGYSLRGKVGEDKIEPFVARVDDKGMPQRPKASRQDSSLAKQRRWFRVLLDSGDLSRLVGGKLDKIDEDFTRHRNWNPKIRLRSDENDADGKPRFAAAFRGTIFDGMDFREWDLSHLNFSLAFFRKTIFGLQDAGPTASLAGSDCEGAKFIDSKLRHVDLRKAYLAGCYFLRADLTGADLTNCKLDSANLKHADLTNANLTGANVRDAETVEGLRIEGASGISPADVAWLHEQGAVGQPQVS